MSCHKSLQKARQLAYDRQHGRCHYCGLPIWLHDLESFRRRYGLTPAEASSLRCTAEHLVARCDGGRDSATNIVAACRHCNATRHKRRVPPDPPTFQAQVQRRIARGRWHPPRVLTAIRTALAGRP